MVFNIKNNYRMILLYSKSETNLFVLLVNYNYNKFLKNILNYKIKYTK